MFLVGLGFVFLSLKITARVNTQEQLISSLQSTVTKQLEAIALQKQVLDSGKEKIGTLRMQNKDLSDRLTEMTTAKEEAERQLAQAQKENKRLAEKLGAANDKIVSLEQKYKDDVGLLKERDARMVVKLNTALEKWMALTKKVMGMEAAIAAHPKLWAQMVAPDKERVQDEASQGHVLAARPSGVTTLVFQGNVALAKGDSYYTKRDGQGIGKTIIGDIYRTVLICQVNEKELGAKLQKGDELRIQEYATAHNLPEGGTDGEQ